MPLQDSGQWTVDSAPAKLKQSGTGVNSRFAIVSESDILATLQSQETQRKQQNLDSKFLKVKTTSEHFKYCFTSNISDENCSMFTF